MAAGDSLTEQEIKIVDNEVWVVMQPAQQYEDHKFDPFFKDTFIYSIANHRHFSRLFWSLWILFVLFFAVAERANYLPWALCVAILNILLSILGLTQLDKTNFKRVVSNFTYLYSMGNVIGYCICASMATHNTKYAAFQGLVHWPWCLVCACYLLPMDANPGKARRPRILFLLSCVMVHLFVAVSTSSPLHDNDWKQELNKVFCLGETCTSLRAYYTRYYTYPIASIIIYEVIILEEPLDWFLSLPLEPK